jgi:hypothetical protein
MRFAIRLKYSPHQEKPPPLTRDNCAKLAIISRDYSLSQIMMSPHLDIDRFPIISGNLEKPAFTVVPTRISIVNLMYSNLIM